MRQRIKPIVTLLGSEEEKTLQGEKTFHIESNNPEKVVKFKRAISIYSAFSPAISIRIVSNLINRNFGLLSLLQLYSNVCVVYSVYSREKKVEEFLELLQRITIKSSSSILSPLLFALLFVDFVFPIESIRYTELLDFPSQAISVYSLWVAWNVHRKYNTFAIYNKRSRCDSATNRVCVFVC